MAPHTTTPRRLSVVVRTPWIRALARRKRTLARTEGCRGMQGMLFCSVPQCHMVSRKPTTFASSLPMVGRRDLRCNKAGSYQNRTPSKACCRFRKLSLHCSVPILSDCPIYIYMYNIPISGMGNHQPPAGMFLQTGYPDLLFKLKYHEISHIKIIFPPGNSLR